MIAAAVYGFVTKHKHIAAGIGAVFLVFFLGFVSGRKTAPVETREVTKVVEKQTMVVQQKMDSDELKQLLTQYAQNVQKNVNTRRVVVIQKDGTKTVTTEIVDKSKIDTEKSSNSKAVTKTVVATSTSTTTDISKTVTTEKLRLRQPDWLVGIQGGVSIPGLLGGSTGPNYLPYIPHQTVLGLTLDHHLLGGLYGGAWANTRGEAGLGLRLLF